ncbi:Alpha/Beta hydrolase protein [Armillaria mellea]|nr:Alpha/Beta hydrolase protein [Armillaria mellea]
MVRDPESHNGVIAVRFSLPMIFFANVSILKVPIDYSNEDGDKAALAVIKLPAQSSTEYKGTVLINPGGPGLSGVASLISFNSLASVIGNQYDIVGFDPRGVANSTPRAEFFLSKEEHYQWLASTDHWASAVNTTSDQIPHLWASAQVIAELAKERDNGILNYIGTDNVARDMLRISEAAGQEKLQYWGFSYGTVIGSIFAAMFPDKVERMVLDGVVDVDGYYSGNLTEIVHGAGNVSFDAFPSVGNQILAGRILFLARRKLNSGVSGVLVDADKDMESFFDGCVAAGPNACAFYAPTAEQISNNLDSLYDSLLAQPVPVVSSSVYGLVDYSALQAAIWNTLYEPYIYFSSLAEGLANLAAGNGTIIYELQATAYDPSTVYDNLWEAEIAITCGDALNNNDSVADLFAYWDEVKNISTFANILPLKQRISCSGWKFHREDRFTGNTADPVTPLYGAKKLSSAFPGSVVLTQNASGHTSAFSSSKCTYAYVQAYFQNGTLPSGGTVCDVESEMFPTSSNATRSQRRSLWGRK